MRLSTRLTLYFPLALALVLAGFSGAIYYLSAKYLSRQVDDRLESALSTLAAAVEFSDGNVEWEPSERQLSFSRRLVENQLTWIVLDNRGGVVDQSSSAEWALALADRVRNTEPGRRTVDSRDTLGRPWRTMARRVGKTTNDEGAARSSATEDDGESAFFTLVASVSLEPAQRALARLALSITGLSALILTCAVLFSRRLAIRILRPLLEMAESARTSRGALAFEPLPRPQTGDELEELGAAFNGLLERLRESYERQSRFAGDASHQLRTPLTAVLGEVDLALRRERSVEEYRRVLEVIRTKSRGLREIVETLLFLARSDADAHAPRVESLDLHDWLSSYIEGHRESVPARAFALDLATGERAVARTSAAFLGQALDILIDNAIKYSPADAPIRVTLVNRAGRFVIGVHDRGAGVPESERERIFQPFHRTAKARELNRQGAGLGLAIAKRLTSAIEAEIGAGDEPGGGSVFWIRLPETPDPDPKLDDSPVESALSPLSLGD